MEPMITVKLFAILKEKAETGELLFPGGPQTVGDLLRELSRRLPSLAEIISQERFLVSVNREFAGKETPVKDGDEVGIMPPFSGGDGKQANIRIQHEPFSLDAEVERVKKTSKAIGAVVTFLGATRDISRDRPVSKLDFEHYPGMAEQTLAEIRDRAIRDFGVIEVSIIHRLGTIPAGENIVLIIVASGHRDEAFRACRFCIDELKRISPIWKRETTPDGDSWVEEHP